MKHNWSTDPKNTSNELDQPQNVYIHATDSFQNNPEKIEAALPTTSKSDHRKLDNLELHAFSPNENDWNQKGKIFQTVPINQESTQDNLLYNHDSAILNKADLIYTLNNGQNKVQYPPISIDFHANFFDYYLEAQDPIPKGTITKKSSLPITSLQDRNVKINKIPKKSHSQNRHLKNINNLFLKSNKNFEISSKNKPNFTFSKYENSSEIYLGKRIDSPFLLDESQTTKNKAFNDYRQIHFFNTRFSKIKILNNRSIARFLETNNNHESMNQVNSDQCLFEDSSHLAVFDDKSFNESLHPIEHIEPPSFNGGDTFNFVCMTPPRKNKETVYPKIKQLFEKIDIDSEDLQLLNNSQISNSNLSISLENICRKNQRTFDKVENPNDDKMGFRFNELQTKIMDLITPGNSYSKDDWSIFLKCDLSYSQPNCIKTMHTPKACFEPPKNKLLDLHNHDKNSKIINGKKVSKLKKTQHIKKREKVSLPDEPSELMGLRREPKRIARNKRKNNDGNSYFIQQIYGLNYLVKEVYDCSEEIKNGFQFNKNNLLEIFFKDPSNDLSLVYQSVSENLILHYLNASQETIKEGLITMIRDICYFLKLIHKLELFYLIVLFIKPEMLNNTKIRSAHLRYPLILPNLTKLQKILFTKNTKLMKGLSSDLSIKSENIGEMDMRRIDFIILANILGQLKTRISQTNFFFQKNDQKDSDKTKEKSDQGIALILLDFVIHNLKNQEQETSVILETILTFCD